MIDTKKYELNSFLDNNGSNLLHCCVKTGNVASLAFFKSLIDINKPNNEGITPLILASINQDKGKKCRQRNVVSIIFVYIFSFT